MRSYVLALVVTAFCFCVSVAAIEPLPNTAPLDWPEADLSGRMMDGAHRFVEQQIAQAGEKRQKFWPAHAASMQIEANRQRLREIIGAVDQRAAPRMERFGDDIAPALVAETASYRVYQVRWPVLDGLCAEGLLVQPTGMITASIVVLPDCNQTPEQMLGLLGPANGVFPKPFAGRLAESGCQLLIPAIVSRTPLETDDPQIKKSNQTSREWIYRQAYHMGRHPIGYEVQKTLAAIDWFMLYGAGSCIGVAGYGDGGQIALFAAAIDTRILAALISGYFDSREETWSEPLDRNLFGLLDRFGDAEVASLIGPRHTGQPHLK